MALFSRHIHDYDQKHDWHIFNSLICILFAAVRESGIDANYECRLCALRSASFPERPPIFNQSLPKYDQATKAASISVANII